MYNLPIYAAYFDIIIFDLLSYTVYANENLIKVCIHDIMSIKTKTVLSNQWPLRLVR